MTPEERVWFWRCREALIELPDIVAHVRALITETDGRSERGDVGIVVVDDGTGGQVQLLGLREESTPLRLTAVDDLDQAYSELVGWVEYWSERLDRGAPLPSAWRNYREVQGFRADTTWTAASMIASVLSMWLRNHHAQIGEDERGGRYFEDFTRMVWRLRAKYPLTVPARRIRPVLCPLCGQTEMTASWYSERDVAEVVVRCGHCGWVPASMGAWVEREVSA